MSATLTAVQLALKPFPAIAALGHIGILISSFLDGSVLIPLDKACLVGSTRLLDRIWHNSDPATEKVHEVSTGGGGVWGFEFCEMGYRTFSGCTADEKVVEEAARHGRMEVLQYLFEYGRPNVDDGRNVILWGRDDMEIAIRYGHGEMAQWLYENTPDAPRNLNTVMSSAVRRGDMNLVQWLLDVVYEEEILLPPPSINDAAIGGHMEMLQWISEQCFGGESDRALEEAAKIGRLDMVQWLVENETIEGEREAVQAACGGGHLNVVEYLLERGGVSYPHFAATYAIHQDHLHILKYLCEADLVCKPERMMVEAAAHGHSRVIEWLLEQYGNQLFPSIHGIERPCQSAMDRAANSGHFEVLKFLHALAVDMQANGESGGPTCTNWALTSAATMGHLEIVKWLRQNYPNLCFLPSTTSMVARNGNLEMLQWLHDGQKVEWSSDAMDSAAENGHLSVVKWLHENREEGCTTKAMNYAARNGHLKSVRWLQLNRSEGFTREAMDSAVDRQHFEILLFLRAHGSEDCSTTAKLFAREHKHPHILDWLEDQYPDTGM